MKRLHKIFLLLALVLVVGHAFVPHQHKVETADLTNPLELIQQLFSSDIGQNHLEDFRDNYIQQQQSLEQAFMPILIVALISFLITPLLLQNFLSGFFNRNFALPAAPCLVSCQSLRAPPAL